ncbi:hypothetical protein [Fibrella forsythiae]|uniref:Right-handed parallel beta-helix repeat-containing protein n=1 Tax=Fibrella forsythiae TaxID=2817061 RepID=A0ABS3JAE9_9BACT|nr:hypothetical protein [Fibrella forsythiae]MBO0946959.1 hypothetical protein [Fibrella forsythiae]
MKFLSLFFTLLISLSASAQIDFKEVGGQLQYSVRGGAYKPVGATVAATTVTSGTATGPVAFTNLIGVPAYLSAFALNAKLETALYALNRTSDRQELSAHLADLGNPHGTTKTQIGLGNVPNVDATNPANIVQGPLFRFMTDVERTKLAGLPSTSVPLSASAVRQYFSSTGDIDYDQQNGQFYLKNAQLNVLIRNYLNSLDGAAPGKILAYSGGGQPPVWIAPPTATTVTGGASGTTSPGGTVVSSDHIFADSTVNRPNFALMVDVPLSTTAQIQSFLTSAQTNKRGIIAPGSYSLVGGSQFTQTGNWDNVALTAPSGATFVATGTTCLVVTDNHTAKRFGFYGITFTSTNTGNGYPLVFSNELPTIQGWEIARCTFLGNNVGNWNAFNITAYSTASNAGATSSDFYLHDNLFRNIPRCGMEILSQGYDAVRLTNLVITANRFENLAVNSGEGNRMATSLSGLITGIYHARNTSTNAKNMAYEFVNVKYAKAESNTAVAYLEPCVGYSISDDGRNSTEQIYLEGGYFNVTSRPFQLYDCKDVHIKGGLYIAGRGIDMNTRLSSIESITATCTNLFNAEAIVQFGGTSNNNVLKSSVLSSWGSAAAGHEPSFETVVLRANTYNNQVTGNTLKQGKRPGLSPATYFTPGDVVNQGTGSPANTASANTVQLEP